MMKAFFIAVGLMVISSSSLAQQTAEPLSLTANDLRDMLVLKVAYSCSPRKTCSKTVWSCDEAYWLMQNCSWGGKLDGDNDGVPCENMCSGG